jgi:hypothetical protein
MHPRGGWGTLRRLKGNHTKPKKITPYEHLVTLPFFTRRQPLLMCMMTDSN